MFDSDHDNLMDYHEFKVAMRALGFDHTKQEVLALLKKYNVIQPDPTRDNYVPGEVSPHNQRINYENFSNLMIKKIAERDPLTDIKRSFQLFDVNGSGKIEFEDLKAVAVELNENITDEELNAMISEFDLDMDNGINENEFIDICQKF